MPVESFLSLGVLPYFILPVHNQGGNSVPPWSLFMEIVSVNYQLILDIFNYWLVSCISTGSCINFLSHSVMPTWQLSTLLPFYSYFSLIPINSMIIIFGRYHCIILFGEGRFFSHFMLILVWLSSIVSLLSSLPIAKSLFGRSNSQMPMMASIIPFPPSNFSSMKRSSSVMN